MQVQIYSYIQTLQVLIYFTKFRKKIQKISYIIETLLYSLEIKDILLRECRKNQV